MTQLELRSHHGRISLYAMVILLLAALAGCGNAEGQLVVIKIVVNDDGGTATADDFTITVAGTNVSLPSFPGEGNPGTTVTLEGSYSVSETGPSGYAESQSSSCSGLMSRGQRKTCVITNDDIGAQLTVVKTVINDDGGAAVASDFTITVTGTNASPASFPGEESPGTSVTLEPGPYSISETGPSGYTESQSADCSGTFALGESRTCTITNDDTFSLTVLHNNDGESQLINAGSGLEDFGGAARFATLVEQLRTEATQGQASNRGAVLVSSGDNFLAGPEFNASLVKGVPFFDTLLMDAVGYDAVAIGNHEFDFGPDVLADFIDGFVSDVPFLSANLDFSAEPNLQALVVAGRIVKRTVVQVGSQEIGIVGATTPALPSISSPRNVVVDPNVADAIQAEVDALTAQGVNKIIVVSHLQDIDGDLALATQLSNVDIMVAGGGDELLANPGDLLLPGDDPGDEFGPYPLFATGADTAQIPVVTTTGNYRYVGRLVVEFDDDGLITAVDTETSGPVRVSGVAPDAVAPDPAVDALVVGPVEAAVAALELNVIAASQVDLDGLRSSVRSVETNEGNLIADALRWQATQLAGSFGVPAPEVALQNGGGIRNDSIIPAGNITELDTFDMVPFTNFVTIIPNIPRDQFKEILENAVSRAVAGDTPGGTGRFAQISGFRFTWDATGTAQELDGDGNVITAGTRVREVILDDNTQIVTGGAVVAGPALNIATIDFLARGGDQYPYRGALFTPVGVTYQQALRDYIEGPLLGTITSVQYPEGGEGRITRLN